MKAVNGILCATALVAFFASFAGAANMTMTGMISDSMCGASHGKMMEMHKDAKMTDRDCSLACVKNGGKFVFVSSGKVYSISNQSLASLTKYAGENVKVTGDVNGDTIAVSKIAASK
ncbi:MAG TPA: hypothetical protein VKV17_06970 [Bryobacteraceae bacterium]|nr:hypothetical protein [Bryobacteraceae bacterium]